MKPKYSILFMSMVLLGECFGGEQITFRDFFSVYRLGKPVVSETSGKIAFTVKKANFDTNELQTHIWIMNDEGTELKQITHTAKTITNPVFSKDGQTLYYQSDQSGSMQLWAFDLQTATSRQLSDIYDGISGFELSHGENHFLTKRMVYPHCKDESCIETCEEARTNNPVKARIIDNLMFRHWNKWLEGKVSHLFLCSLQKEDAVDLTPGEYHTPPVALGSAQDYCFSPQDEEICFVSNHDSMIAASTNNDIFVMAFDNGNVKKISENNGNDNNPQYSPSGKYIVYASMQRAGFEADRYRLMLYDKIKNTTVELTKSFDLSISEILWHPNESDIYFTAQEAGNVSLYKVSLKSGIISSVLQGHYISNIQFLSDKEIVFLKETSSHPREIYKYNLESKKLNALTQFNQQHLAKFDLPVYEEFWFEGAGGDKVQGFIMKPPNFKVGKSYPAVHLIHGGPQGMWGNTYHYRWNYQMFATPGYVVFWINFHGSRGYGQKFTDSITGHWGDLPYEDLVKGTDYVLKTFSFIDPERLAAAGASYGGFMINWIAGHGNPYKCLISHDGVYDQVSMWGATEELWFPEWEFGGLPWQAGTSYNQWSPSRLAPNFKTPMLVIHGENDYRVPYTQSLQLFSALQRQGVPSRLLFFPDEDHFVRKPLNAQLWWQTVHEWLATYLK